MRQGLSLKYIVGGSTLLVIGVMLLTYSQLLRNYTLEGLYYGTSAMMETEALDFAERYKKDPKAPLPKSYFFTGAIGKDALPPRTRELLNNPPTLVFGAASFYGDMESEDEDEGGLMMIQPLADGKTLYLFETDDEKNSPDIDTPLSDAYLDHKMSLIKMISIATLVPAVLVIALLVGFIINPLRRLAQWSTTLVDTQAPNAERPRFNYRELNVLADSLEESMQRVKAASLREERLLRYTSHELRTPLAVLKANVELLAYSSNGELSPPMQRIQRSVLNMQGIAETLLWMSREQPQHPVLDDVDIRHLFDEQLEEHRYLIGQRHLDVVMNISEQTYRLPATACRIIVCNLLRNALQYADEGTIEISCIDQQLRVVNRVREADISEESADFGYGLGLELLQQLCEKLGWRIEHHSQEQQFTVTLDFRTTE